MHFMALCPGCQSHLQFVITFSINMVKVSDFPQLLCFPIKEDIILGIQVYFIEIMHK